jgi:hypothetical protein
MAEDLGEKDIVGLVRGVKLAAADGERQKVGGRNIAG